MDPGKMAIRSNVHQYNQKLQHFYSTALSGEHRDRLEKDFDSMNAYHLERTGKTLLMRTLFESQRINLFLVNPNNP